jgi:hypothetical protein
MATISISLFFLLLACHWAADFTQLSTSWFLEAKKFGKPLFPIACHSGVHAGLMFFVLLFYASWQQACLWAAVEWGTHFLIDVWKGRMLGWFPSLQNTQNKYYWWLFGIDQYLHISIIMVICINIPMH